MYVKGKIYCYCLIFFINVLKKMILTVHHCLLNCDTLICAADTADSIVDNLVGTALLD